MTSYPTRRHVAGAPHFTAIEVAGVRLLHSDGYTNTELARMLNVKTWQIDVMLYHRGSYKYVSQKTAIGGKHRRAEYRELETQEVWHSIERCKPMQQEMTA